MNIILFFGILLILVSLVLRTKMTPKLGFAIVFIIMAFQAGVEGDFMVYKSLFENGIATGNNFEFSETEPVFPLLIKVFRIGPFWLFYMLLIALELLIIVRFVENYCPKRYQYLAAILFYFSLNMMLLQMKGLRQGLAIELMLLAFLMADTKKWRTPSIVVVILAYLTHNSMLVVLPFYVLFYLLVGKSNLIRAKESSPNKHYLMPFVLVGVYFVLYFVKVKFLNQFLGPLILLSAKEGNRFANYADSDNAVEGLEANMFDISPLIVLYDAIIVFLVASYYKKADPKMKVFCIISIAAAFGDMLFFGIGVFARIIMYYVLFNLVVYPAVVLDIQKKYGKIWAFVFMVFLVGYAMKTSLPWILSPDGDRFGNYHFIFMH